ncbi:unnamed protein product, partial [Rotaria sp. Silwood1]
MKQNSNVPYWQQLPKGLQQHLLQLQLQQVPQQKQQPRQPC